MPSIQVQKAILAERKQQFENALWQAEKVDLPIARKIGDKQMETTSIATMKKCQAALALIEEIETSLEEGWKEIDHADS
jgi:hypothetical protein